MIKDRKTANIYAHTNRGANLWTPHVLAMHTWSLHTQFPARFSSKGVICKGVICFKLFLISPVASPLMDYICPSVKTQFIYRLKLKQACLNRLLTQQNTLNDFQILTEFKSLRDHRQGHLKQFWYQHSPTKHTTTGRNTTQLKFVVMVPKGEYSNTTQTHMTSSKASRI